MLLHDARRESRIDPAGDLVVLDEQNRSRWNRRQIAEAQALVGEAREGGRGPYALQAAIAAEHCKAGRAEDTDWREIVRLYDQLQLLEPSPIILLNRAVAIAMAEGLQSGLALVDTLAASGDLENYHLLHATRADLLRRMGLRVEAAQSYLRALELVANDRERRYLQRRLGEVQSES
jgi:RNA polymerase sigma-70 factor (ECF subfamily)